MKTPTNLCDSEQSIVVDENNFLNLNIATPIKGIGATRGNTTSLDDSVDSLLKFTSDFAEKMDSLSEKSCSGDENEICSESNALVLGESHDELSLADGYPEIETHEDSDSEEDGAEETDDQRFAREEAESEALARQLMAEEALHSYAVSADFLRENANQFSTEDFAALQAAMAEEDPNAGELDEVGDSEEDSELSYDTMLRIAERVGDVKTERWVLKSKDEIEKLPKFVYEGHEKIKEHNDSTSKCLVCQCPYEMGEELRALPCKHCFHSECVDHWLSTKDFCPYCRQPVVSEE
eukprot:CAMPEP_0116031978 /NCGR_PEP_ID=MMETSP0321-20121206/17885_1 /TAXON_ID=163516 /ORGANISM="Leptocylindrus danicus var. danicus, Strain B650" /LENGTH=293 /DNA_ID=CAMNT_0003507305 /DNA_START=1040 /DNA_END=1921 /DNA_ORIENTATION=-